MTAHPNTTRHERQHARAMNGSHEPCNYSCTGRSVIGTRVGRAARMSGRSPFFIVVASLAATALGCHGPPRPAAELIEQKPFLAPEPKKGPPFDPRAARGALWQVDVSHCKALGVPQGRGHSYVTFSPEGGVTK